VTSPALTESAAAAEVLPLTCGDARAEALLYRAAAPDAPCVLVFPALGTAARPYQRLAQALQAKGVHVLLADWRGVASSSVRARRGVDWSYLDLIDGEAQATLALARRVLPLATLHAMGHSLGGQVALMHAARYPAASVASICLVASATPHFRAYPPPHRWLVLFFAWLTAVMVHLLGVFRGDWLRFGGRQGATLMREWSRFARSGAIPPLPLRVHVADRWDAEAALVDVRIPIYLLSMQGDTYAPTRAGRELADKTRGALTAEHLSQLPSGRAPGHFEWLREPEPVAERMVRWLKSHST